MVFDTLQRCHRPPDPRQLHIEYPLSARQQAFVTRMRTQVRDILDGIDHRLLLIVGPCSIHDSDAALEYASKLQVLSQSISQKFLTVMRFYFEKPRTVMGWKGLVSDPYLDGSHDISAGLKLTRTLLLQLAELELPVASELLDPLSAHYFGDLITWGCIGARTVESPLHRQMASGLPMPIAFKNTTGGDVKAAANGILAALQPHTFVGVNRSGRLATIKTSGNPYGHMVLRGGKERPNYDAASIEQALQYLVKLGLPARLIVDCSHDNSGRNYLQQPAVFQSVVNQVLQGNKNIRGLLLESHLNEGSQALSLCRSQLRYAVSITDGCLDWESTQELILWGHALLGRMIA